jgi:hypothetical protein
LEGRLAAAAVSFAGKTPFTPPAEETPFTAGETPFTTTVAATAFCGENKSQTPSDAWN